MTNTKQPASQATSANANALGYDVGDELAQETQEAALGRSAASGHIRRWLGQLGIDDSAAIEASGKGFEGLGRQADQRPCGLMGGSHWHAGGCVHRAHRVPSTDRLTSQVGPPSVQTSAAEQPRRLATSPTASAVATWCSADIFGSRTTSTSPALTLATSTITTTVTGLRKESNPISSLRFHCWGVFAAAKLGPDQVPVVGAQVGQLSIRVGGIDLLGQRRARGLEPAHDLVDVLLIHANSHRKIATLLRGVLGKCHDR